MENGNTYTSSVINNYGDVEQLKQDAATLRDILNRQGSRLLLEVIANSVGEASTKFKFDNLEQGRVLTKLVTELSDLIVERI